MGKENNAHTYYISSKEINFMLKCYFRKHCKNWRWPDQIAQGLYNHQDSGFCPLSHYNWMFCATDALVVFQLFFPARCGCWWPALHMWLKKAEHYDFREISKYTSTEYISFMAGYSPSSGYNHFFLSLRKLLGAGWAVKLIFHMKCIYRK